MAVESELIDCRVGEPHVTPEQIADVNIGTYGNEDYVLSVGNKMKAELITNNSVRVFDGVMMYGGLRDAVPVNKYYDMTIDNGAQGKNRNDIIVRRYTKEEGASGKAKAIFAVVKGTPVEGEASDPVIEFTDIRSGALTHDMPLHRVRIEGLNIVAVEPMFDILMNMAEQQAELAKLNSNRIGFPDYSNIIEEYKDKGFTASADGWLWVMAYACWTSTVVNVNGVGIFDAQILNTNAYPIRTNIMIPVKKGDVITISSVSDQITADYKVRLRLYGIR